MPSMIGFLRFAAAALIAAYIVIPGSGLGPVVLPAFLVFFVATVISMRKASTRFDLKGLKRLRDLFPRK